MLLTSCSAEWHIKRAIKKNPHIFKDSSIIVRDTIVIRDSIFGIDTFVMHDIDTINIEREGIKTQIIRYRDRFIVNQKIKGDTIFREKIITIPKIIYMPRNESNYGKYLIIGGFVIVFWFLSLLLGIIMKKST